MVARILMMGTSPCKDKEEARHDPDETGRTRMFSLVRAPPILVSPLPRPIGAVIGHSACSKLVYKLTES